jgi:hypothetical protein
MGVHFGELRYINAWQGEQVLSDAEVYLPYCPQGAAIEEAVVAQQSSCQGIFNGHEPEIGLLAGLHHRHQIFEGMGRYNFYWAACQKAAGRYFVKSPCVALYGYSQGGRRVGVRR